MKLRILILSSIAALLSSAATHAAPQNWDAGVNSNWDTATLNWCGLAWLNGNDAVFGAVTTDASHPFLSGIFSDNMVLQRGTSDPVWGWTNPGARVTVSVVGTGIQTTGTAGADGKWMVQLQAPPVGGPYTVKVVGPQCMTLNNVLVGDVWLCAGQSNMQLSLSVVDNATAEIAAANFPNIRLVSPTRNVGLSPRSNIAGQWQACSPATVPDFSAVGYFFGRKLYQDLNVPIGLINVGWGGSVVETWSSREAILQLQPGLQSQMDLVGTAASGTDIFAAWYAANDPGSAGNDAWASPTFDDSAWVIRHLCNTAAWGDFPDLWYSNYTGTIWFRNTFTLSSVTGNMTLNFNGAGVDTVWINGVKVGGTLDMTFRHYIIPANLLKAGTNSIVFRFLEISGNEMIGVNCPDDQFTLVSAGGVSRSLAGDWKYHLGVSMSSAPALPLFLTQNTPSLIYNGVIAPLVPFQIKGAIWYQGEANTGDHAAGYRQLLPLMIASWRSLWGLGDFPFYIVQLPYYGGLQTSPSTSDAWSNDSAEIRESQAVVAQTTTNSGLAVTIELGDASNVHTTHKQEVGRRLALIALAKTYGENLVCSGPVYSSMAVTGSAIQLNFDTGGSPLAAAAVTANGVMAVDYTMGAIPITATANTALTGFVIAGADKQWQWATATLVGNSVVVSSPLVPNPVAVRYAWAPFPPCNLINQACLPASPFRTDNWPLVSLFY